MSIVPSASTRLVPVPIPDRVAALIGSCMPIHVLQAEVDGEFAFREVLSKRPRFGALLDDEDRHDREQQLSVLAFTNKVVAAHSPRLVIRPGGGSR